MCVLLFLIIMSYKYLLSSPGLMNHLISVFPYCFLSEWSVHWCKWDVKVSLSISPFISIDTYFIYLGALILGAYMFMNIVNVSSFCIHLFIIICLPLYHVIDFVLKSTLSDEYCYPNFLVVSICMEYLFPSPHFPSVSLALKWLSYKKYIDGYFLKSS